MSTRSTFAVALPITVIVLAVSASAFFLYDAYRVINARERDEAARLLRVADVRAALRATLAGVRGVNVAQIESGFWYSYRDSDGNESVYYFDLESAAQREFREAEIRALAAHIASSSLIERSGAARVAEESLPPALQFHNSVYASTLGGTSTADLERALTARIESAAATSEDLSQLSYLQELRGDYARRDALDARNCKEFGVRCAARPELLVKGRVVDDKEVPIEGAVVSIVSRPTLQIARTTNDGTFELAMGANEMEKLRLRVVREGYSDGYADAIILPGTPEVVRVDDIELERPEGSITIDFAARSVTGSGNTILQDGTVVLKTPHSEYRIPRGAIVRADGSAYTGKTIRAYLYEFTRESEPQNLVEVDTFDEVRGYAGDIMKSFGMPYIQFFSPEGEELHVLRTNPMALIYRIPDMGALRANTDRIYGPLTSGDMRMLVEASKVDPHGIDREFLIENRMLRFPAFWVLDRKRGVWDNVGVSVLDERGAIETTFYTINNTL